MESVLSQSEKDFEYIVIDGGSDDGSKALIESMAAGLSYWVSESDSGIYEAMNKGIEAAKGKYLLFINSGDLLADTNVIKNVSPLLDSDEDIIYGNLKINQNGTVTNGYMPDIIDLRQMMNDTLWHPVSFIKKELFNTYGKYNTSYRIVGDYEFFFNVIISKHATTKHIQQFIAVFDLNGMSSSPSNIKLIKQERERAQYTYLSAEEIEKFKAEEEKRLRNNKPRNGFFRKWFR